MVESMSEHLFCHRHYQDHWRPVLDDAEVWMVGVTVVHSGNVQLPVGHHQ